MTIKFTVIDKPHAGSDMHPVQIDEGEFAGCQVVYGALAFSDEDPPTLKFDYEIVNDYTVSKDRMSAFVDTLGDLIIQILEESLDKNETIYKGGA